MNFSVPIYLVEVIKSECHKSRVTFPVLPVYENDTYKKLAPAELYKLTSVIHRENQFLYNNGQNCLAIQNYD